MVLVELSLNVARWMKDLAIRIFQEGYNSDWTPEDAENAVYAGGGFVDRIPLEDVEARAWIEATMSLLRCLAAILATELSEDDHDGISITMGDSEI